MKWAWGDRPAVRKPRAKRERESAKHKSTRRTLAIRTVGPTLEKEERSMKKLIFAVLLAAFCATAAVAADNVLINGAGATFPYPIYSKWFDAYHKLFPTIQFNYQSIRVTNGPETTSWLFTGRTAAARPTSGWITFRKSVRNGR